MIDLLIIVIIAFISLAFSSRNSTPQTVDKILYNSDFKEDSLEDCNSYDYDEDDTQEEDSSDNESKSETGNLRKSTPYKSRGDISDKDDYLEYNDINPDYNEDDIRSSSKALIKEILGRE